MARRGIIVSHVPPEALEPDASHALQNLGYEIVPAGAPSGRVDRPIQGDLRIVDEESLGQIAAEEGEPVPIITLTRRPTPLPADRRVIASLTRPARFQDLYPALQKALERTPRSHPRIPTTLPARCAYDDRTCTGVVVSLSEGGCLFRSADEPPGERETSLQFPLPRPGLILTRARHVDKRGSALGLAFQGLTSESRFAISQYVMDRLITD
ncbi:MAG: PilZ domain-containing protein [Planctomycetota bacterium]|jgi:hypothetical protein